MPGDNFALEAHLTPPGWFRLLGYVFGIIARRQNRGGVRKLEAILERPA